MRSRPSINRPPYAIVRSRKSTGSGTWRGRLGAPKLQDKNKLTTDDVIGQWPTPSWQGVGQRRTRPRCQAGQRLRQRRPLSFAFETSMEGAS